MSVTLARNQRLVKDLETWIREATTEAAITTKGVVPDDPDYFDYIKKHDQSEKRNRQDHDKWEKDQEADSVDLSPYKNGLAPQERLIRIAYPAGVEYAAKMDVGYRNYQKVKKWVINHLNTDKKAEARRRFQICHDYFAARHVKFVEKLQGEAKHLHDHMDDEHRVIYEKLYGHQKTNFLMAHLANTLLQETDNSASEQKARFWAIKQLEHQSAAEYLEYLDRERSKLPGLSGGISDKEMMTKITSSMNTHYRTWLIVMSKEEGMTLHKMRAKLRDLPPPPRGQRGAFGRYGRSR